MNTAWQSYARQLLEKKQGGGPPKKPKQLGEGGFLGFLGYPTPQNEKNRPTFTDLLNAALADYRRRNGEPDRWARHRIRYSVAWDCCCQQCCGQWPHQCQAYREQRLEQVRCPALALHREGTLLTAAAKQEAVDRGEDS